MRNKSLLENRAGLGRHQNRNRLYKKIAGASRLDAARRWHPQTSSQSRLTLHPLSITINEMSATIASGMAIN